MLENLRLNDVNQEEIVDSLLMNWFLVAMYRAHFIMNSSSGTYKIQKGQKVVGNCHLAQRDKAVFGVPGCKGVDQFDPTRFNHKVGIIASCSFFSFTENQ